MTQDRFDITVDPSEDSQIISFEKVSTNPLDYFQSHFSYTCDLVNQTVENVENNVKKVLGYTPEEFEKVEFFSIYHPEDRDPIIGIVLEAHNHLIEKKEIKVFDTQMTITGRMLHKDGHYLHIQHVISYSVLSENGFGVKSFNIITDISNVPFHQVTGHLKCDCMEIGSNFSALHKSESEALSLTNREKEILKQLYLGKSSKQISDELFISKHTVDKHRGNMLTKVGAANTQELIAKVLASGVSFTDLFGHIGS